MRLALVLACLALAACAAGSRNLRDPAYIVQPGDTLYSIAWRYGIDYRTLASWNELDNPDLILIGQRIRLTAPGSASAGPATEPADAQAPTQVSTAPLPERAAIPSPQPVPPPPAGQRVVVPAPQPAPPAAATDPQATPSAAAPDPQPVQRAPGASATAAGRRWQWPTDGPVISEFGSDEAIASGIGIGGQAGQSINAAADGNVVYAGSGLNRYGQLVIIKHDDSFLSAYGYNDRLLVNQGDDVRQGQKIAEMGFGPQRTARLHFEIRRDGVPVDPAQYLATSQ